MCSDTRFMCLMEQEVPSYATFHRFCNNVAVILNFGGFEFKACSAGLKSASMNYLLKQIDTQKGDNMQNLLIIPSI